MKKVTAILIIMAMVCVMAGPAFAAPKQTSARPANLETMSEDIVGAGKTMTRAGINGANETSKVLAKTGKGLVDIFVSFFQAIRDRMQGTGESSAIFGAPLTKTGETIAGTVSGSSKILDATVQETKLQEGTSTTTASSKAAPAPATRAAAPVTK